MGKKTRRRAGRPRNPDAKRHQTTRAGRAGVITGTEQNLARRALIAGDAKIGLEFPLDVLLARRLISEEMRDEGLRFAQLCWWRYGLPFAGPELLYERMVTGVVDAEMAPAREIFIDDPDAAQEELAKILGKKARLERMERALKKTGPAAWSAVKRVAQFLELPAYALNIALAKANNTDLCDAWEAMLQGLLVLVSLRNAEDRNSRRRSQPRASRDALNCGLPA